MSKSKKTADTTLASSAAPTFWSPTLHAQVKARATSQLNAWDGSLPKEQTLSALLTKTLPPQIPLISPWLHAGESCLLWGGTGCGKSMVSIALALGVAGGGEVFGWTFPAPRKVLFVDGEQSERDLKKRFESLAATVAGLDLETAAKNLTLMARTAQAPGTTFIDIAKPSQAADLVDAVERNKFDLVIFDNLSTLTDSIENENSAAQFKHMQNLLAQLKGRNVAGIVVHHADKSGEKYRGSSAIATTFERIIGLLKDRSTTADTLSVVVRVDKFRDKAPKGFQPEFPLTLKENSEGVLYWEIGDLCQLRAGWNLFKDGEHTTKEEFVELYNATYGTAHNSAHFKAQFKTRWLEGLRVPADEIADAERAMEDRRRAPGF